MSKKLDKGDKVEWDTPQGATEGTVQKRLTANTKIKGHKVAADVDDQQYLVKSDKSLMQAAYKPSALGKK